MTTESATAAVISSESASSETAKSTEETTTEAVTTVEPTTIAETEPQKTTYKASSYKIGQDMPAGEYVLYTEGSKGYFSIRSDSSGTSDSIIANDNFINNSIVTVYDDEYFEFKRCYAVPIEESQNLDISDEGLFKVGLHIEPGEYKLSAKEGQKGYMSVLSSSRHGFKSIVTNDNFQGEKYITVSEGQYLKLSRAYILQ